MTNLPYTKTSEPLDAAKAFTIASFLGWQNALAEASLRGDLDTIVAIKIVGDAEDYTNALMLGEKLDEGKPSELSLDPENPMYVTASEAIHAQLLDIADALEQQEQNDEDVQ